MNSKTRNIKKGIEFFFFPPTKINNHRLPSFLVVLQPHPSNLGHYFHLRSVDLLDEVGGNQTKQVYEVLEGDFEVGCCVVEVAPQETG
jgi:hypothetical protein